MSDRMMEEIQRRLMRSWRDVAEEVDRAARARRRARREQEPIPGPRIKITPELRDKAGAVEKDGE